MDMLRVIVWGKFSPQLNCPEDISMGRSIFLPDFLALIKNDQKLNKKRSFFSSKQEAALRLKMNRNYYVYDGIFPSSTPCYVR